MKPYHSIILFIILVGSAAVSSFCHYSYAKDSIIADMNQALAKTLATKKEDWITPDTIADYRSHLETKALRQTSIIFFYSQSDKAGGVRSDKMTWYNKNGQRLEFQGYANCSTATIFAISNQRIPTSLFLMALLWGILSTIYFHQTRLQSRARVILGEMVYDKPSGHFLTLKNIEVKLTPMQEQLLKMFFHAEGHLLSKQEICNKLWLKKPDANDTLYTLIRRIKPVIADKGLTITNKRGKGYRLEVKKKMPD